VAKPQLSEMAGVDSTELFKVLSSDTRRDILKLLQRAPMSTGDLAEALSVSRSSITRHVQSLSDAGLIITDEPSGARGGQKVCRLLFDRIAVSFDGPPVLREAVHETEMPLGLYANVHASPPCGLAGPRGIVGSFDDPQAFLLPDRAAAQLIWIGRGFVEYAFPNKLEPGMEAHRLELAMEIGSEIALHRIDAASDVTIWVNGVDIGTWTSLGGLGDRRGRLTPEWWWNTRTQYGMLKVWSVDLVGSYVDGSPVSSRTLPDLDLVPQRPIVVRIGVKPDAVNRGGINLFGRGFGNYEQDIILRLHYDEPVTDTAEIVNAEG
jgi:predicted transcriptional regulator